MRIPTLSAAAGVVLSAALSMAGTPTPSVNGTITVDGTSTPVSNITATTFGGAVVVAVSDVALEPPCTATDLLALADKGTATGVLFSVDPESLSLASDGSMNLIAHPAVDYLDGLHAVKDGLSLDRLGGGFAHGTLITSVRAGEKKVDVHLEVTFPLDPVDPPPAPRVVEGADSKPGRQFQKLVKAWTAGDLDGAKKLTLGDFGAKIDQLDPAEAAEMMISYTDLLFPETMTITDTKVDGDHAVLTVHGVSRTCGGTEESTGTVELQREKGAWKVGKMSFEG